MLKSGYVTTEFWLYAAAAAFAAWAGYFALTHPEVEMERFLAVVGAVTAAAWAYGNQRTSLKKDAVAKEPPPTTVIADHVDAVEVKQGGATTSPPVPPVPSRPDDQPTVGGV